MRRHTAIRVHRHGSSRHIGRLLDCLLRMAEVVPAKRNIGTLSAPNAEEDVGCRRGAISVEQRSGDVFLGVPFNIASYALLTIMMAQVTGLKPGEFIHTLGDTHLYLNHLEQARLQLARTPHALPTMQLNPAVTDLFGFRYEDFKLEGYAPDPPIRAKVAV